MSEFLIVVGIILLVVIALTAAPLLVAWALSALFGWSFWLCFWLAFGVGLLFGGVKVTTK